VSKSVGYAASIIRARARRADARCPYCGCTRPVKVGYKHMLLTLFECPGCGLKYRFPKDDPATAVEFYEHDYRERSVTDVPGADDIRIFAARGFAGSAFDRRDKVAFLANWVKYDAAVLDYGASFGYMLHQMRETGFSRLTGFEVSKWRAEIARSRLGLRVFDSLQELEPQGYDCIYASHVLEHLPDLATIFPLFRSLLRPSGLLCVWTPNASREALQPFGGGWAHLVGEPHTVAIDYDFLGRALRDNGFEIRYMGPRQEFELCVVAQAVPE